ncbi:MAG: ABC transporter ATP-binding protein, partial [Clostridia bacterium]
MLKLTDITKNYKTGDTYVQALKGVSLEFREHEFVSILGQSGCGKTTLLNIIGGLDKYSSGELTIDGISTKKYSDVDWDTYRNKRIGFIFQSYNLIGHIDILANVELALILAGIGREERKERAIKALEAVGLADQIHKRPNQLSGGQMQRVSIARALINNPTIILADEPTGALDSATSVQIMEILSEISKTKLVVMVTHNPELAEQYSTRTIRLRDGLVTDDSNPYDCAQEALLLQEATADGEQVVAKTVETVDGEKAVDGKIATLNLSQTEKPAQGEGISDKQAKKLLAQENKRKKLALKKSSMTWWTAIKLSFQNLLTKKGRTVMTSIAGSIGIIGVALVLAISNGMNAYILSMQKEVLANYPVEVSRLSIDTNQLMQIMMGGSTIEKPNKFPPGSTINPYDPMQDISQMIFANTITQDYVDYVARLTDKGKVDSINYSYGIDMPVISEINRSYFSNSTSIYSKVSKPVSSMPNPMGAMGDAGEKKPDIGWQQMSGGKDYVLSQYDLLAGEFPTDKNQVVLVIDKSNQLSKSMLASMGLQYNSKLDFADIIGNGADKKPVTFRLPTNNAYYQFDETAKAYKTRTGGEIFNDDSSAILELQVVGILRQNPDAKVGSLGTGVAYTQEL